MTYTLRPESTPRKSREPGFTSRCFFRIGDDETSEAEAVFRAREALHNATSMAKFVNSWTRCSGDRCPYSMSSLLSEGQEHSIKIVLRESGNLGAATCQMRCVCGFVAKESGSTSPKNKNSFLLTSWRMKKAVDWYGTGLLPWLIDIIRAEILS